MKTFVYKERGEEPRKPRGIAATKADAARKIEKARREGMRSFRRAGVEAEFAEAQKMKRWG